MKTPVLLLMFNRPDTTTKVFDAIRKAKPSKLFIAADGARNDAEWELCNKTRDVVKNVDWECEVHTQFRDENLGCKYGINKSITWFFENVDQGIILEDDCLPSPSFFEYCDDMLERYKYNENVGVISGNNFMQSKNSKIVNLPDNVYYFVAPIYTWGWATWKRAWDKQELEMESWPEQKKKKLLSHIFKNKNVVESYSHTFDHSFSGRARTWDAPWLYTCLLHNMMCIVPPRNLTSNIGVIGTTSRTEGTLQNISTNYLDIKKLKHPNSVIRNTEIENILLTITDVDKPSSRRHFVELLKKAKLDTVVRFFYRKLNMRF